MNKQIYIIVLMLTCQICNAQNLVPNPSFEQYNNCPVSYNNFQNCAIWQNFGNSSEYYHTCGDTSSAPPDVYYAYQYPRTGNAYVGIVTYALATPFITANYREFIGVALINPLVIGTKYYLSFYISNGGHIWSMLASNKIGIKFSTVAYSYFNPPILNNNAHLYTDSIVTDTLSWTHLNGSFVADSMYQYLIIGNFFDSLQTSSLIFGPTHLAAYYVIDDVCVSTDSLTCNSPVGIDQLKNEDEMILFPNPFSDKINITTKGTELIEVNLYDVTARKIFNQSFVNSTSINTEQLAKGIYLYEVRNENGVIKKGKVLKD